MYLGHFIEMVTNGNEITSKNIFKFICINCDFKCSNDVVLVVVY